MTRPKPKIKKTRRYAIVFSYSIEVRASNDQEALNKAKDRFAEVPKKDMATQLKKLGRDFKYGN